MMAEKIRVLYVDDDPHLLDIGKKILEKSGDFIVSTSPSASEAIRILGQDGFDAIVSDYQMPEMDGIEFLKQIKAEGNKTPFIIITGKGCEEVVIDALNAGSDGYLQKGGEPKSQFAELSQKINKAVKSRHVEEALVESEEKLRSLFQILPVGVTILDKNRNIANVNPALEQILSFSKDELMRGDHRQRHHIRSDGTPMPPEEYASNRAIDGQTVVSGVETGIVKEDGAIIWTTVSAAPLAGDEASAVIVTTDITERKQAEETLRESEARYRSLFEGVPIGLYRTTPSGQILDVNPALVRLLGYPNRELLMAISVPDLYMNPLERTHWLALIEREGIVHDFEVQFRKYDGTIIWVRDTGEAILDDSGQVQIYYNGNVEDITDRKQDEKALRESEAKFRSLVEHALEGILILDLQGTILFANNAMARTLEADDRAGLIGRNVMEFVAPESREDVVKDFIEVSHGHDAYLAHYNVISAKGNKIVVESIGKVISYEGKPADLVSIRDITEQKKAEDALQETNEYLRKLIDFGNAPIIVWSPEFEITLFNQASVHLTGRIEQEVIGQKIDILFPADSREASLALIKKTLEGERWEIVEIPILAVDGTTRTVLWNTANILTAEAELISTFAQGVDVTERKRGELKLKSALKSLKEAHHLASIGTWDWVKENDTVTWSEELYNIAGRDLSLLAPTYAEHPHVYTPASWDRLSSAVTRALTTGEQYNLELELVRPDGSIRWVNTFGGVKRDGNGNVIGLHGTVQDITERKRAEESLQLHSHIVQNMAEGVIIIRASDGMIVYANPRFERMFGYDPNELIGRNISTINAPDDRDPQTIANEISRYLKETGVWNGEVQNIRKDGTTFWCYANVSTFHHQIHGQIWISVHEDITERKQAEDTLKSTLTEKEVLLREIHHRVKNNLAGIISLIDLQIGTVSDPVTISLLKDLETRIRSMALVHESLYRTEDLAHISFTHYTEELTRYLFQAYGTQTDIRCRIEMGDVTMPIETAIPCGLVMSEIVTNSLKYAFPHTFSCEEIRGEPCTIALTLHRENSDYLLNITDNGTGIPEGNDVSSSHSLGLFLIGFIVEHQLRGSLEINTAAGTAYTIRFPVPEVKERNNDE